MCSLNSVRFGICFQILLSNLVCFHKEILLKILLSIFLDWALSGSFPIQFDHIYNLNNVKVNCLSLSQSGKIPISS